MYHIYGIGNALVDQEFGVDDAFLAQHNIDKGMMTLIDEQQLSAQLTQLNDSFTRAKRACGGSAANSIIGAQYLGANTFYTCHVANDEGGDFYVHDLQAAGVDTNMAGERTSGTTGTCIVMVTPDAERTMNTFLGITSELERSHIDVDALKQSQYAYLEGYLVTSDVSRAAAIEVRTLAEQHGVKTAMTFSDPAMVQFFKDGLNEMMGEQVDLLFCNEQEALLFTEASTLDAAIEALKTRAKQFAITLGSQGAVVFDGSTLHNIEPFPVTAVDSNGAGDAFAGAFMYAITHGYDAPAAGKLASAVSSSVVGQYGPRLEAQQYEALKAAHS